MRDCESMVPAYNYHADDVDYEEPVIDVVNFGEVVCSMEFKLESKCSPKEHEPNLAKIESQAYFWLLMDDAIVNCNKWHQRHVPQEILRSHDLVKSNEGPGLDHNGKKDIVMKGKPSRYNNTPLRNKSQNGHDFT